MAKLTYGWLCWSDEQAMLSRDAGVWTLHVERVREYLCGLANAGVDEVRILPYGVWGPRPDGILSQFSPYVVRDGKFDLSQFNDWYFPIMRRFIQAANEYGLRVRFVWFDNCQLHGKFKNPWETNVQGVTSFYGKDADDHARAWIDRIILEFAGLDVSWAFGNETEDPEFVGMAKRVLIPAVRDHGLDPARLAYGACMTPVPWNDAKQTYWGDSTVQDLVRSEFAGAFGDAFAHQIEREVHGCGTSTDRGSRFDQACNWWGGKHVGPFRISDDGTFNGASKCDREDDAHVRPSAEQWTATVNAGAGYNNIRYEHLPKGGSLACQVATLRAIYRAANGRWPEQKYVYTPLPVIVQVAVCPDSGLLPNKWCPATELREFEQGHEPTGICAVHKAKDCKCRYWLDANLNGGRINLKRWILCILGLGGRKCK